MWRRIAAGVYVLAIGAGGLSTLHSVEQSRNAVDAPQTAVLVGASVVLGAWIGRWSLALLPVAVCGILWVVAASRFSEHDLVDAIVGLAVMAVAESVALGLGVALRGFSGVLRK